MNTVFDYVNVRVLSNARFC